MIFTDLDIMKPHLEPACSFTSLYLLGNTRQALTLIVPMSDAQMLNVIAVAVYYIDVAWIEGLIDDDEALQYELREANGYVLFAGNASETTDCLELTAVSQSVLGFSLALRVPRQMVIQKLSAVTWVIKIFIAAGMAGILFNQHNIRDIRTCRGIQAPPDSR